MKRSLRAKRAQQIDPMKNRKLKHPEDQQEPNTQCTEIVVTRAKLMVQDLSKLSLAQLTKRNKKHDYKNIGIITAFFNHRSLNLNQSK